MLQILAAMSPRETTPCEYFGCGLSVEKWPQAVLALAVASSVLPLMMALHKGEVERYQREYHFNPSCQFFL